MTTQVIVSVPYGADYYAEVEIYDGTKDEFIEVYNGQSATFYAYGERSIHVREVKRYVANGG